MGSMGINIHFRSLSLAVNARCAPTKEPNNAMEMQGNANPQSTNFCTDELWKLLYLLQKTAY